MGENSAQSTMPTTDSTLYYKAVGSIILYFTTVISALVICIARTRFSPSSAIYILIAVASLITTWYYIISFFKKEYESLGSNLDRFILESDLFVQAYAMVTNTLPKWWWSSQLLILTGTAITSWSVEGQTLRRELARGPNPRTWTPTWWFVLLGFFGSMSVGGPLFFAQLGSAQKTKTEPRTVPTIIALLILLGEVSVIITPFFESMSVGFKWNLIITHALFFIPSIITFNPESQRRFSTFSLPLLYFFLSLIGLFHHLIYSLPFVFSPIMRPVTLYNALWFNHCQTSISADLIFNNILAAVFIIQTSRQLRRAHVGAILVLLMPVLSVSTIMPLYLGWKERQLSVDGSSKEKKEK